MFYSQFSFVGLEFQPPKTKFVEKIGNLKMCPLSLFINCSVFDYLNYLYIPSKIQDIILKSANVCFDFKETLV